MDLASGLSAASTAISIVRDLRDIDRSVDEASYKLKLAELSDALADAKISLADAKQEIQRLEAELDTLQNGEMCPKCHSGRLELKETKPSRMGGLFQYGVEEWFFECSNGDCSFAQKRMHDPHGVIPKRATKR